MHSPELKLPRRAFLKSALLAASASLLPSSRKLRAQSANDKLNIAIIGVANQGNYNLENVASQNIVALCDVDDRLLNAAANRFPSARKYHDFRRMLEQRDIDAVVVSTPDHTHAVAAVAALQSGRHLYCEKPLARTISETRIITETARRHNRVTQMGTQIHAGANYRRVVELLQTGAIGPVNEVHVWVGGLRPPTERPTDTPPVPEHLHYDLWLGPIPPRPYHPAHLPFNWRHWWVFAGGALADLGCHHIDLAHWALGLTAPLTIEAEGPAVHPEIAPPWCVARYTYPARGAQPPVLLTWYHGGKRPPHFAAGQLPQWGDGTLFVGEKGMLLAGYDAHRLLPEEKFSSFQRPAPFIPDSIGHHREWIEACKSGQRPTCHFEYAGALTEAVLLGNVAYRTGKKIVWDSAELKAKGCPEAAEFIQHQYRPGWSI